jgi:hypothetical protein
VSACVGAIEIDRARVGKGRVQAELRWGRGREEVKKEGERKRKKSATS